MRAIDIALKDLLHSLRSTSGLAFMFIIPLMVTGMFYLLFGEIAQNDGFEISPITVVVANLDHNGPRLQVGRNSLPEGIEADSMGELVLEILKSDDLDDLLDISEAATAEKARLAVDQGQWAQAAVILPADFSKQFADIDGQAIIQLYVDPTLTIGPGIVRSILSRFIDGIAGVKIAADEAIETIYSDSSTNPALVGQVVGDYLDESRTQTGDLAGEFLKKRTPQGEPVEDNPVLQFVTPIMGGMMIFYAFFTGTSAAQSILREEEGRTLARLFTTPAARSTILTGKFLAVFLIVLVQVTTLIFAAHWIFGIEWGAPLPVAMVAMGIVLSAATAGIFINAMIKNTQQGGMVFGGVLTISGMLGMVRIFAMNSPNAARMGDTVALLVPQGWAVRGILEATNGKLPHEILPTLLALLLWSAVFFSVGIWRFRKRYS